MHISPRKYPIELLIKFKALAIIVLIVSMGFMPEVLAQKTSVLTLNATIETALSANLALKSANKETLAAQSDILTQRSNFLPTLGAGYQYTRQKENLIFGFGTITPEEEYGLSLSASQPLFAGFSLLNRYRISQLGADVAKLNENLVRQQVVFDAKNVYFSYLKVQKLLEIARQTVKQIEAQRDVAENFFNVGMTPLNDLLQAQVELANARQAMITAQNNLEIAQAQFNLILRRPMETPVVLEDVLEYVPLEYVLEDCLEIARNNRPEIKIADRQIEIAEKEVTIAAAGYYPALNLEWLYTQQGTEWDARGGAGLFGQSSTWEIKAMAQWNFFEFGRTHYQVQQKKYLLERAEIDKTDILEAIALEVKQAYLKMREAEKNIDTIKTAIEQANENYRINQERYQEQVATSTDVLIAQTLLSRTMTNYYNALYDFKISKAALLKAMSLDESK